MAGLALSTNSYHSSLMRRSRNRRGGLTSVEPSSVPGWTEHVLRDATDAELAHVRQQVQDAGLMRPA